MRRVGPSSRFRVWREGLVEHLVEATHGFGPVPHLGSRPCLGNPDLVTEAIDQPMPYRVIERGRIRDVEGQLDAGVRPVGVLATRTTGGVEAPSKLGIRDIERHEITGSLG
jgi:hypothetical protein